MTSIITFSEAFDRWSTDHGMGTPFQIYGNDYCALAESWNDFTDNLCKDGELNDLQYHHCPAWDETMPDCDGEFLLKCMGVEFDFASVISRPDGLMSDLHGGTHWRFNIKRGENIISGYYSMGTAYTGSPDNADVFNSLLMDTSCIEGCTFEEWAQDMGYDTDSREAEKIYEACKQTFVEMSKMFTKSELSDLREVFQDY